MIDLQTERSQSAKQLADYTKQIGGKALAFNHIRDALPVLQSVLKQFQRQVFVFGSFKTVEETLLAIRDN